MELIKRIKEAENQAKEIVSGARSDAAKMAEESKTKQAAMLAQAEDDRKKAVDAAVTKAEQAAVAEVQKLAAEGATRKQEMEAKAKRSMDLCVERVVEQVTDSN